MPLFFPYYGGLFLGVGSEDMRQMVTLVISEIAVLAGVDYLLYAAEGARRIILFDRYALAI